MLVGSLILAGGRSQRMGKPKESLPFGTSTLLGHTSDVLLDCAWPVLVVTRDQAQQLPPLSLELEVVHDDQPGKGPLHAIATGMRKLLASGELGPQDAIFVTGCDAPYLTSDTVAFLVNGLGDFQCAVPKTGDTLHPLCAVYRLDCLPAIEELLKAGVDSPRTLVEKVKTKVLDEATLRAFDKDLKFLRTCNTHEEYEAARRDFRK
ncbi:MAG: molybdenum cofactor guanylyltransferase [Planctomycetota bacterium]